MTADWIAGNQEVPRAELRVDVGSLGSHFESLTNPRHTRNRKHLLVDIVVISICGTGVAELDNAALYYSTIRDGLLLTPNEGVMQRAIDRQLARDAKAADAKPAEAVTAAAKPGNLHQADDAAAGWLGESLAVKFDHVLPSFFLWFAEVADPRQAAQTNSWSNLPILNEWKRRYPDRDPVEVHTRFWNTELACPGGGKYVWNEQWRTMESTVFGHPGEPKLPEKFEAPLFPFAKANFGITFELDGLRSRLELLRKAKSSSPCGSENSIPLRNCRRFKIVRATRGRATEYS